MKWESTTIGEQCIVTSSKRVHLSERSDEGVPFYCSKEIIQKYKGEEITECDYIREEIYTEIAQKFGVPQENDLLVTTRGTIGIPYLYRNTDRFYFADGNLTWMKNFKKTMLPQYLYYWFLTHEGRKKVEAIAKGTAQKAVPIAGIKGLKISLPSIAKQRQIIGVLSAYDNFIENNQKQIKLLEEAAQRLYKEWFVDLRFPGHENTKITDGIPKGWRKTTLAEIAAIIKRGISPKYADDGKYTVINQKCIRGSVMDITESRKQEKQYELTLNIQDCDTVICSTGTGTLGRVGQIYGDYPNTTFDSHVTLVRAKENPNFMYHVIKNQQEFLMGMGRGSTNQQELYRNVIENIEVLLPDRRLLLQTEELLNTIHNKIETVYSQTAILTEARDCMLPKLMSGEIEV